MKKIINEYSKKVSLVELLSLSFFISVGFSLIFKYAFYNQLNIIWYLNSLTPQYILISTLFYIFPIITGILIGLIIGTIQSLKSIKKIVLIFFIVIFASFFMDFLVKSKLFFFALITINCFIITSYSTALFSKSLENQNTIIISSTYKEFEEEKKLNIFFYIFIFSMIFSILSLPYLMGVYEAKYLLKNKNKYNLALLKDNTKWRIIEMNNDKILLISNSKDNSFLITEYKEVKKILPN